MEEKKNRIITHESDGKKINPDFKEKWLKALRSGDYAQCQEVLKHDEGGFCCLGVALDIREGTKWIKDRSDFMGQRHYGIEDVNEWLETVELPVAIRNEIGLSNYNMTQLMDMNDSGYTFSEIADWIAENL